MKNVIPAVIIGMIVLSGLGASAVQNDTIQPTAVTAVQPSLTNPTPKRDYTHTVLVEVGTATWCPSCPQSNDAWHSIYGEGTYDFEYTELVYDKNPVASARFYEFNPKWVPTSYWDGGEFVYPGTNTATFYSYLDSSGSRIVPDLIADLNATWLGSAQIQITYDVLNNDASAYSGRLKIYVIELVSTLWNDYSGDPYYHAFLDFPVNEDINISAGDTLSDTVTWDGTAAGYPNITPDNIQVILAVFGDTPHQSYSDPPSGNPFWAYYSDEAIAVTFGGMQNNPPSTPTIDGPTQGTAGNTYTFTFSSTDPEGDDIYYCVNWSDDTGEICIGPFASGEEVTATHTWSLPGTYLVKVKARDIYNAESDPGTLEVIIGEASSMQLSVAGGFGITATIKNNGTINITNIDWSITLDGTLVFIGKSTIGTIPTILMGDQESVKSKLIMGFGKTNIDVQATCDENITAEITASGFVIGPFVLGVK